MVQVSYRCGRCRREFGGVEGELVLAVVIGKMRVAWGDGPIEVVADKVLCPACSDDYRVFRRPGHESRRTQLAMARSRICDLESELGSMEKRWRDVATRYVLEQKQAREAPPAVRPEPCCRCGELWLPLPGVDVMSVPCRPCRDRGKGGYIRG